MDLHNNEVGRDIAEDAQDRTHFLMPSNEVPSDQTYDSAEKPWLADPHRGGHHDPGAPSAQSEY